MFFATFLSRGYIHVTEIEAHDDDDEEVADTRSHDEREDEVVLDQNTTEAAEEKFNDFVVLAQEDEINQENEEEEEDVNDKTRHSLFEKDEYEMGRPGSVIELVKKTKEAQDEEEFKLEDQIDEAAYLFIYSS